MPILTLALFSPCVVLVLRHKRSGSIADAHNFVSLLRYVVLKPYINTGLPRNVHT